MILPAWLIFTGQLYAQQLQLHYDFRHSIDPQRNAKNFPSLSFEYFRSNDSTGSFLLKMQTDLQGEHGNAGQFFLQLAQNFRYWKPKIYLSLNFTGGLGVAPPDFSYYLTNTFALGAAYPFGWKGAWLSANLAYRYTAFRKASHDAQFTFYFGRGFFHYRVLVAGSLVAWTENRNQGTDFTQNQQGKKFSFFGDPQIWCKVGKRISLGSRLNVFFHVVTPDNAVQVYPTLGLKQQF